MRGFAPARRDPFVSAKGSKTMGAQARPFGCLCHSPEWFGLRNSLRSNSPRPQRKFGTAAQPRLQAPSDIGGMDGAVFSLLSSPTRSGIQGLCFFLSLRRERHWILDYKCRKDDRKRKDKDNDTGSSITNVEDDRWRKDKDMNNDTGSSRAQGMTERGKTKTTTGMTDGEAGMTDGVRKDDRKRNGRGAAAPAGAADRWGLS